MNTLVTLTGPSCSGKTHLRGLLAGRAFGMGTVVTATTRLPRKGERDGVDYHFWSNEEFALARASRGLVEDAEFCHARYGTPVASLVTAFERGQGRAVQVIEPQGLKLLHAAFATHPALAGCRLLPVFVDCARPVIAERFLRRYRADLDAARERGPADIEKVTRDYGARLATALTVESAWRPEADGHPELYSLIVEAFGPETEADVLDEIVRRL